MYLSAGQKAPEFNLPDENGEIHTLQDYTGKHVLLYFYPKDDTPGCTTEACNFRDDYSTYEKANVVILGVSPDTPTSHKNSKRNTSCLSLCWRMKTTRSVSYIRSGGPKRALGRNMMEFTAPLT